MNNNLLHAGRAAALACVLLAGPSLSFPSPSPGNDKDDDKDLRKHYALIFGTAYGPDERPMFGVNVVVHAQGGKRKWELISDHRGEFAVRVPPGPGDYVIEGKAEIIPTEDGKPQKHKQQLRAETKVHIDKEERQDVSLHLNKQELQKFAGGVP
jgi:hypothetical protein